MRGQKESPSYQASNLNVGIIGPRNHFWRGAALSSACLCINNASLRLYWRREAVMRRREGDSGNTREAVNTSSGIA